MSRAVTACLGKIPYATASGAHEAMKRIVTRAFRRKRPAEAKGRELTVYRCSCCHHWHLGNTRKQPA